MTTIEIDNKLYKDILQWCEVNGVDYLKYIEKTLRERLATDKYGDLNEKMNKKTSVKEKKEETVAEKEITSKEEKKEIPIETEESIVKKKRTLTTK